MTTHFEDLLALAERHAERNNQIKDTVLKEILHRDILTTMHRSGLSRDLVFQGGTALRLCYGNTRYSEDLDFVRSEPLDESRFEAFKAALQDHLRDRYGLRVRIADPKKPLVERSTPERVAVHRWVATIEINDIRIRNQKIHIEVADVPAYDAQSRTISNPYADNTRPTIMQVSSMREIMADKIIAVAGRPYFKARDIWDIKWLMDRRVETNLTWVEKKAVDYHLAPATDSLSPMLDRLTDRIANLAQSETLKKFKDEMSRFLTRDQAEVWIEDDMAAQVLLMEVGEYLERQRDKLATPRPKPDKENMAHRVTAWREKYGGEDL